ncbi:MAG: hypothetical protein JKY99_10510, partial [Rhizobiales bacterium]|nr:hypothetical protein [Hyphomicrobiales bacterium]
MKKIILLAGIIVAIVHPAFATDFVVSGANTQTNGTGNASPITGGGHSLTVVSGASITGTALGIFFRFIGQNTITNNGLIDVSSFGIYNLNSVNSVITNNGQIDTSGATAFGIYNRNSSNTAVINNGQIDTSGATAFGIYNLISSDTVITNSGQIDTTGATAYGILNNASPDTVIINSGQIDTSGTTGFGIYNLNSSDTVITNSGQIDTSGVNAYGIYNRGSVNSVITNSGQIDTSNTNAHGIFNVISSDTVITNSGQIDTSVVNARGIFNSSSSGVVITNSGQIETLGTNAAGIYNTNSLDVVITNSGQIDTSGANAHGIYNLSSNDAVITNSGQINTSGNSAFGIYNLNSNDVAIFNSGSIRVSTNGLIGVLSSTAVELTNSGLIFAATTAQRAINLSNGNDSLTLSAGSRIQGRIRMAAGTDTVTLDHNGHDIAWRWTFENFTPAPSGPDILVVNGAPFVVQTPGLGGAGSTTVTVADLSREATAGAVLGDLSSAIRGAVSGRIAQAWALNDAGINSGAAMLDEQGEELGWNAWTKAFGGYQSRGAQGLSGRTGHHYGGVVVGADTAPTSNALFGAFGGYAYSSLAFEDLSLNKTGAENIETHSLFAGVFGRIESAFGQNGGGLFADGTLTLGYAAGDPGTRLQANNLVTGGIEEITGGDASGVYADTSIT